MNTSVFILKCYGKKIFFVSSKTIILQYCQLYVKGSLKRAINQDTTIFTEKDFFTYYNM